MANKIILKRSSTPGKAPSAAQLDLGEIAINTHDGRLYIKKNNGTESVVEIGGVTSVNSLTGDVSLDTSLVAENGSLYFTNARARSAVSAGSGISYNSSTGVISTAQGLTTSSSPTFAGLTLTGNVTMTGNIVPTSDNVYSLGSPTMQWKDVYVGPGSLYVNGVEVIHSTDQTMNFTSDIDQNMRITTTGTGILQLGSNSTVVQMAGTLQIQNGKNITDSSGSAVGFGNAINMNSNKITSLGAPSSNSDAATKKYVDDSVSAISTSTISQGNTSVQVVDSGSGTVTVTVDGSTALTVNSSGVVVAGNFTVSGTTTTVNSNTVAVADNILTLNSDTTGAPTQNAGVEVERGDEANTQLRWNEGSTKWTFTNDGAVYYPMATSTTDLAEGTKLYYTDTRARSALSSSSATGISYNSSTGNFSLGSIPNSALSNSAITINGVSTALGGTRTMDTDSVSEGTTNLYFTNTRARGAVSASGSLSYNSTTGVFSYTTPSTSGITEGTNLYYTDARARSAVSATGDLSYNSTTGVISFTQNKAWSALTGTPTTIAGYGITNAYTKTEVDSAISTAVAGKDNTDEITEGTTNLYFTNARARAAISVSGAATYNSTTGVINVTGGVTSVNSQTGAVTLSTTDISEGTNLYHTDARSRNSVSAGTGISYNSTTGAISADTSVMATKAYVDSQILTKDNTDEITEGTTNLYFTTARARNSVSAGTGISYNSTTGVISTSAIPNSSLSNSSVTVGSTSISLGGTATTLTGLTSVSSTGFTGALTGNADTATTLKTARTINGVSFDGSANVTVHTAGTGISVSGTAVSIDTATTVDKTTAQTLTNKTFTDNSTYFGDETDTSKKMQFQLSGITTATTRTLTVPDVNGTIITTGDTGTVTNTMLAGSIANAKLANSSVTVGTTAIALGASSTTLAGLTSVTSTGFTGALTGNASTATALQTARTISGTSFDGSANITLTTTGITEGTNLYYTDTRARGAVSAGTGISYNSTTGVISTSAIPNSSLSNSAITVNGASTSLGGSVTVYAGTTSLQTSSANQGLTGISTVAMPGSTSGTVTLQPAAVAGTGTVITLPATTGTVVTTGDSGSVTNTMLAGSIANAKLANSSVTVTAGTGMSGGGSVALGGTITLTNAGVTGLTAGTGISVNASTGAVTVTNSGVTSLAGTANQITASGSTGAVTLSFPSAVTMPGDLTISGNLTVSGTTTTINASTVSVADINIELGKTGTPTNATADGGGITLKGATDKTFNWVNSTSAWTSSEHIATAAGKSHIFNGGTSGSITVTPTAVAGSNTLTLPAVTGTVVTTGDTGSVTNTMLAGSIATSKITGLATSATTDTTNASNITSGTLPNARLSAVPNSALANSSTTIGTTAISLGSSSTTLAGLTSVTSTSFVGALTGNASTVTNGVYTTDTGTVTNTMLAGSIANTKLANSSITVNNTAISLGSSATIKANTNQVLTIGTGLSGTSFDGSAAVTVAIDSTVATLTGSQTLTNKTLTSPTINGVGAVFSGSISGTATIVASAAAGTGTIITLPAQTGTVVTTGDTGSVTNTMLAGSIANSKLSNSSVTIGSTAISLGSSSTTLAGLSSVTSTYFYGALTGNASTATQFATARTISGTSFDGTANITLSTSGITEGTNLYYTDARARGAVSAGTGISYNSTTGAISCTITQYDNTSARAALSFTAGSGAYNSTTGVITIPTNTNQLTNGAGFITSYTETDTLATVTARGATTAQNITLTAATASSSKTTGTLVVTGGVGISGGLFVGGEVTAYASDAALKTNVVEIDNALSKVESIRGVSYDWNEVGVGLGLGTDKQIGVIAQEVEAVLPELVVQSAHEGYKTVKYDKLTALLIEAVKELSAEVKTLKAQLGRSL